MTTTAEAAVVDRLLATRKYSGIARETVEDIVRQEAQRATKRDDAGELERRARLTLHRAVAHYLFTSRPEALLRGLDEAAAAGDGALRAWCRDALARHFSTAERLADLDDFYGAVFAAIPGPVAVVADVACAVNPLTLPWLRDVATAAYVGYDFNAAYVDVGRRFLEVAGRVGDRMEQRDVLVAPAEVRADVALLLKTYHCIELRTPGAALDLVCRLDARHVVVSFPLRSMTGGPFGTRHADELRACAASRDWTVDAVRLRAEELLVVAKGDAGG